MSKHIHVHLTHDAPEPKYKVGQIAHTKYDVEQPCKIEKVEYDRWSHEYKYHVRVHEGGYVNNRSQGVVITVGEDELW